MDHDDPEKRIADLERQLAEPRDAHDPGAGHDRLTADEVHNVAFSKPPPFKRGYDEDDVDAFLERVETTLRDPSAAGGLKPADLHGLTFSKPPIGKRGYNEEEVDSFLRLIEIELNRRS